ncbi:MAG: hypothetical protein KME10_04960 [Plectolyngbya sp. WJT66-NPBG17]|jgi:hypothetical protein|nr:hypothetical protein [Plectolyngbya sp. WJT66-NPBG17]MBW4524655.1 hypothetical protein [Phormidium tanganyikae FI6-MK23]
MQASLRWSILPTTIAAVLAMSGMAFSQTVSVAPNAQAISLNGTSGGAKKDASCAGFVADRPNHTVQVTADSNLKFTLQGSGEPTLLITGAQGQAFCVQADRLSNGKVEIPGRWTKGTYSVFVGDRAQGRNPYTLLIAPQN